MIFLPPREDIHRKPEKWILEPKGQGLFFCYQYEKHYALCPSTERVDLLPNQFVRLVQLNRREVPEAMVFWIYYSCFPFVTECSKGINMRYLAERSGLMRSKINVGHSNLNKIPPKGLTLIALVDG